MSEQTRNTKVAFIGLGAMGLPMAKHLVAAGFHVAGYDVSEDARNRFADENGKVCGDIATALWNADFVVTMLPNGRIVRDALLGDENWRSLKADCLVIDMSSSAPTDTQGLAADLAAKRVRLIDAPVSGGVKRAISGNLSIMVGGDGDDIDRAMPLLARMGESIFRTGPIGSGHAMKAINNYVSGAGVVATIEGVLLGKRFGLDPETIVDILNVSSGRSNTSEVKMKQFVLSETFNSGFALGLMAKDIGIASGLAAELGMQLPALSSTARIWAEASRDVGTGADHTEIAKFIATKAENATEQR